MCFMLQRMIVAAMWTPMVTNIILSSVVSSTAVETVKNNTAAVTRQTVSGDLNKNSVKEGEFLF